MRKAPLVVAISLLAAAGPAAAQASKPGPPEERPASPPASPPAAREPRLNLNLDHPAQYARETPREGAGSADPLPSLGGNARPLPGSPTPTTTQTFPKDAERGER